jgi:hypothetical protein
VIPGIDFRDPPAEHVIIVGFRNAMAARPVIHLGNGRNYADMRPCF